MTVENTDNQEEKQAENQAVTTANDNDKKPEKLILENRF